MFKAEENCWRVERAERMSVLIDAAAYYSALRQSMLQATSSIFIVGWDIDSRIRLAGSEPPDDGAPERLRDFLCHLVEVRPGLRVHVLMWDFSVLYALEREPMPALNLSWATPPNVEVCLDDIVPLGASHHQKIVIVDGKVAFCGGLDLAACRWDNRDHALDQPLRVDSNGKPYKPFHDVQAVVDGAAAEALTDLVHRRWEAAACQRPQFEQPESDPWPASVRPDFTDIDIAIARTIAPLNERPGIYEVERMYLDLIAAAEDTIYIENQFLTADRIANALAEALREKPDLQVVLVSSRDPHGFLEAHSMATGRARFMAYLNGDGAHPRVRLVYPFVSDGERSSEVLVHAKVMVVDDTYLRIGSSNLNNRSMGTDGECDLIIAGNTADDRRKIRAVRDDLLGEHLGLPADRVGQEIDRHGGLCALIDAHQDEARTLRMTDYAATANEGVSDILEPIADPERPSDASQFIGDMMSARAGGTRVTGKMLLGLFAAVCVVLISIWQISPLAEYTDPERLEPILQNLRGDPWAYVIVPLAIILASAVLFPISAMIAASALVFPPVSAFFIAFAGALCSAALSYALGQGAGRQLLRRLMGRKLNRLSRALARRGLITVIAMRLVPVAPFTLINLAAGASHIGFRDFMIGSLIGLLPAVTLMTVIGNRLWALLKDPTPMDVLMVSGALVAWLLAGAGAQRLIRWLRARQRTSDA